MSHRIIIQSSQAPSLEYVIQLPDEKVAEIHKDNDAAISIARAITAQYIPIDEKAGKYWRILKGHKFYTDFKEADQGIMGVINDYLLMGEYESHTTKIVEENVKEGDICIDAGASVGYFTLLMARNKAKEVMAFEPTKNLYGYLLKNTKNNGYNNITTRNQGLFSENKIINVNGNATGREGIEAITLDSLNIPKVDFIKMDIDGSEPEALKGMIQTIERSPNLKMVVEFYPEYIKRLGNNPQDMMDILDKYFDCERIKGDGNEEWYNLFCVRKG